MQSIETIAEVNQQGLMTIVLPRHISPGKHRIVLVIDDADNNEDKIESIDHTQRLMQMAGRISAFNSIDDPVLWQQQQRDEWNRSWDKS